MRSILVFILLVLPAILVSEGVKEEWVARYDGGINKSDWAEDIAIDNQGNIYVTGCSYGLNTRTDFCTVKYSNEGKELWMRRYIGPANDSGSSNAITVDNNENIIVTGFSNSDINNSDYCTIKYDSEGNEIWVRRYDGPALKFNNDHAIDIVTDNIGNVYVTGYSSGGIDTAYDYCTIKYDSEGNEIWVSRYDGPGNGSDYTCSIKIDDRNNIYVTGYSEGLGTGYDYCTIKYNNNGEVIWIARYQSIEDNYDQANDVKVDRDYNVYVTGSSFGSNENYEYCTIKYDSNGQELWVKRFNNHNKYWNWARSVDVDVDSNVYVTGKSGFMESGVYVTIKYDKDGNEVWEAVYDGPGDDDGARKLIIDDSGNIYVTGSSKGVDTDYDYCTIKYDENGNQLWIIRYNGPGSGRDICRSMVIDEDKNIYITGYSWDADTYLDYCTIKYYQTISGVDIKLTYFNAKPIDDGILLNWSITGEDDNFAGFNLYRQEVPSVSNNPVNSNITPNIISWKKLNSEPITGRNPYQYTDKDVSEGKTYEYRLEAVYKKNLGEFSETLGTTNVTYSGEKESFSIVSVYPNPASDVIHCVMNIPYSGQVRIEIYDISGRRVSENSFFTGSEGKTEENVDVSKLTDGVYEIKAFLNNECASARMIISR